MAITLVLTKVVEDNIISDPNVVYQIELLETHPWGSLSKEGRTTMEDITIINNTLDAAISNITNKFGVEVDQSKIQEMIALYKKNL